MTEAPTASRYEPISVGDESTVVAEFVPDEQLAAEALQLALKLNHPAYDCTYLACAGQKGAEFITADKKFLNKLR